MAQLTLRRGEGGVLDQPYEMHCTVDFVVHICSFVSLGHGKNKHGTKF